MRTAIPDLRVPAVRGRDFTDSKIGRHLVREQATRGFRPCSWPEFKARIHAVGYRAWLAAHEPAGRERGRGLAATALPWVPPPALDLQEGLSLLGMRDPGRRSGRPFAGPLPVTFDMLLLAYEADPRPIAWAMRGLSVADLLVWLYQDVARHDTGRAIEPFEEIFHELRLWIKTVPRRRGNSALRHIRSRVMALFALPNTRYAALLNRAGDGPVLRLLQKLAQTQDGTGRLRDYREMREDLNRLSRYVLRARYGKASTQVQRLDVIRCPGSIEGFDFSGPAPRLPQRGFPRADEKSAGR